MIFRFKQFSVDQAGCTMKINTDGVLLGALADVVNPIQVLDIGTGTGVVALMLAQRFPNACIDAIDINSQTCTVAIQNFKNSVFGDRIDGYPVSFQEYFEHQAGAKYDLIVSNPPFFINSLESKHPSKNLARHTGIDFFEQLIQALSTHLSQTGLVWLILPHKVAGKVQTMGLMHKLFVQKMVQVYSFSHSTPHRVLIAMGREQKEIDLKTIVIYNSPKEYSLQYQHLLKDFLTVF